MDRVEVLAKLEDLLKDASIAVREARYADHDTIWQEVTRLVALLE